MWDLSSPTRDQTTTPETEEWILNHWITREVPSVQFSSVTQSCLTLQPHGLQHARPPSPSPTPGVYSNSRPSSRWCHPTISSSVIPPFSSRLPSFPNIRVISSESVLCIRWPKYWSFIFSISPSNKYSGLISFRIDWLNLLALQGALKSPAAQFKSINSSVLSFLYSSSRTLIHDYWKNHSFDEMDLCWQSNVSAF